MKTGDMQRLAEISQMIVDQRLGNLRRLAAAKAQSEALLGALELEPSDSLGLIADAQTNHRYQLWADARRAEINLVLARQTAEWMVARTEAATALGKVRVLDRLTGKRV